MKQDSQLLKVTCRYLEYIKGNTHYFMLKVSVSFNEKLELMYSVN